MRPSGANELVGLLEAVLFQLPRSHVGPCTECRVVVFKPNQVSLCINERSPQARILSCKCLVLSYYGIHIYIRRVWAKECP